MAHIESGKIQVHVELELHWTCKEHDPVVTGVGEQAMEDHIKTHVADSFVIAAEFEATSGIPATPEGDTP